MFYGCENLEYINIKNFNEIQIHNSYHLFDKVPDNIVICVNNTNYNIIAQILNNSCYKIDCSYDWKLNQNRIIKSEGTCLNTCDEHSIYKFEYNGKCYANCTNGYLLDDNANKTNKCKCELDKCLSCPTLALKKSLCSKCNENYFRIENDNSNIGDYINCYKNPEGYYLDKNDSLYKKCFYRCKTCELKGNNIINNCLMCNSNFSFGIKKNNYFNCYEKCDYYYFFDETYNNQCTINGSCPIEYPTLIRNKTECIKNNYNYILKEISKIEKSNEIEYFYKIIEIMDIYLNYENYNTSNIDNGKDEVIEKGKIIITFTTAQNQKNNNNKNITTIDLKDCEISLRNYYNKTKNETLYIKKLDIYQEGMKTVKVKFDTYFKIGNKLEKLNLSVCKDNKISISIPVIISENLDILNGSSGYYNDICYPATSDSGTDISLKDRRKNFIEDNKTVCQDDCKFKEYDYNTQKAICSCNVKELFSPFNDININKDKLLDNFKNIKNIANLNILICYKKLFTKKGVFRNFGSILILLIILFHIISIFIFFQKQLSLLIKIIEDIIYGIKNYKLINEEKNYKNRNIFHNNNNDNTKNYLLKRRKYKKIKTNKSGKIIKKTTNITLNKNEIDNENERNVNFIFNNDKINSKIKKRNNKIEMIKSIMKYNNDEINSLTYDLALQYDKRTYWQYYFFLIKTKNDLITSFCNYNDYNSTLIKIDLLFLGFTIEYAINALFYNDDTMHNIYENHGEFDIEYQLPKIIYSSLISTLLNTILKLLALSNDNIIDFKQNRTREDAKKRGKNLIDKLKIKFIFYFIICFILLLFFWYYISMFGVIYNNTQYYLFKDTLLSFVISLIYPLLICLLPGIFRIASLSDPKKQRKYLYNLSKIIQIF